MPNYMQVNLVAFYAISRREVIRFLRIWTQTLLPPVISTVLYLLVFGQLVGGRIGEMSGLPYVSFIVPGLVLMAIITNAFTNVVSSFFTSKFSRFVEELIISPVQAWVILAGYVAGGVARGVSVGILVMLAAMFFTPIQIHSIPVTVAIVILSATLFSLAGFINALFANSFDDVSIVPTFILTPLTYLGGVFFSISLLPDFWAKASMLNPVLYMINAFRYGLQGVSDVSLWLAFSVVGSVTLVLAVVAILLLRSGYGLKG